MSDTIGVVDEERNTSSIMEDAPFSIANSRVYNRIAPWFLVSLGTFYISFLLYRYCSWRFRRRRVKRVRMERQKVEKFWRKRTAYIDALTETSSTVPTPLQTAATAAAAAAAYDEEKYVQNWSPSFDSSATLVGIVSSSDYYMSEPRFPASSVQDKGEEEILEEEQEASYNSKYYKAMQVYSQRSAVFRNTATAAHKQQRQRRKSRRERLISTILSRINGNHQRKKRRQLLWQWSVAMGYCRYYHGHDMNIIIQRLLLEEKRQKSICNSIAEKETAAAESL
ncbi:uncharacterized protein ATC70_010168 [Mucor velutinosus]|uniref:Uncharacterized protein n=1 Tax=Mucor velutinosus TaxID=708070 RepID=A0AAN7DP20_9FUNG|nr:hypothetical protein ATC70_010168 [Mucor velutinosus]